MNRRDTHFLPGMPSVPRGHAKNVGFDPLGIGAAWTTAVLGFGVFCLPGGLFGWAVVACVGGLAIWRSTRPGFEQPLGGAALVARVAWVGAALALIPVYLGAITPAFIALRPAWHEHALNPLWWLAFDACLAAFAVGLSGHLRGLARPRSERWRRIGQTVGVGLGGLALHALALPWAVQVHAAFPYPSPPNLPTLWLGLLAVATHAPLLLGGGWLMARFWTDWDAGVDRGFAKLRLLGAPAAWTPFGYHWLGVAHPGEWRVVAETARVPPAVRIEVTLPGLSRLQVRRRQEGERADGVRLTDPVLSSTLVVSGMSEEDVDVLLEDCHESLLPAVHGLGASVEKGVLRVDLWVPPEGVGDGRWMRSALSTMVAAADGLETNRLEAQPRTDEVIRQLEEISRRQGIPTSE